MKPLKAVVYLSLLIAVLAFFAAGTGLFWQHEGSSFSFTNVRGEVVDMYGKGAYQYESLLTGAGHRGVDAVTLAISIPLLVISVTLYAKGSLRGAVLLLGVLANFLYVYATMALNAAYNDLFLVYVTLFSASFFSFTVLFQAIYCHLNDRLPPRLPRRSMVAILLACGFLTLLVWLSEPVISLMTGEPPVLRASVTLYTHAFDLAIIVPALFLSGVLILRKAAVGYLIGFPLLFIIAMLAPAVTAMTWSQIEAGIVLTPAEVIAYVAGFVVLGLLAIMVIVTFIRQLKHEPKEVKG